MGLGCLWERGWKRGRGGWLRAGRSRPSPPVLALLPLQLFHSATLKEWRVGREDGARESPEFHGNRKFSSCERKLWQRICERRSAHLELSISGFPARPSPPFTPPSLPSPEARTPHLHGQGSLKAPRAQSSAGAGELGWAGLGCSIPAHPHPPAASAPAPSGAAGREAKGAALCSGKASPPKDAGSIAAVAMNKPPQGSVGLRGGSGALSWGHVWASRPVLERCCHRSSPAWQAPVPPQRRDRECDDGNRGGENLQGRALGGRGGSVPGGGRFGRAVMSSSRPRSSPLGASCGSGDRAGTEGTLETARGRGGARFEPT